MLCMCKMMNSCFSNDDTQGLDSRWQIYIYLNFKYIDDRPSKQTAI